MTARFLGYEQPGIRDILVLSSFAVLLPVAHLISEFVLKVGLTGQILLGGIYGLPLANLLRIEWQHSFLAIGHLGLVVLVFEGAVSTDVKLLGRNLFISILCASTGIILPIALSILSAGVIFHHSLLHAFVAGASLSATSMGTTIAVIQARDTTGPSLFETRTATVLLSAAVLDDIIGLIMASVVAEAQDIQRHKLAWAISRPFVASIGIAIVTAVAAKAIQTVRLPLSRWQPLSIIFGNFRFRVLLVICILLASTTAAFYAGTSVLFGAFSAGLLISFLDNPHVEGTTGTEVTHEPARLRLRNDFRQACGPIQDTCLVPLFFASMGFSIPFRDLWSPKVLWQGAVYTLLMALAKAAVGLWIPIYSYFQYKRSTDIPLDPTEGPVAPNGRQGLYITAPALLLAAGMIARGEIGLLICQIGFNSGKGTEPYDLFLVSVWALLINTMVGPILVGLILNRWRPYILSGKWGIKKHDRSA